MQSGADLARALLRVGWVPKRDAVDAANGGGVEEGDKDERQKSVDYSRASRISVVLGAGSVRCTMRGIPRTCTIQHWVEPNSGDVANSAPCIHEPRAIHPQRHRQQPGRWGSMALWLRSTAMSASVEMLAVPVIPPTKPNPCNGILRLSIENFSILIKITNFSRWRNTFLSLYLGPFCFRSSYNRLSNFSLKVAVPTYIFIK